MHGHHSSTRGRPAKTHNLRFRLLALAGFAEGHQSLRELAASVNQRASSQEQRVTAPTVGAWLHRDFDRFAQRTITITSPHLLELRVVRLLFRVRPDDSAALAELLAAEPHVSRIERWSGEVTVSAEAVVRDSTDLENLVQRLNPDMAYDVVSCRDNLAAALIALIEGKK
jgi:hypothetical protein